MLLMESFGLVDTCFSPSFTGEPNLSGVDVHCYADDDIPRPVFKFTDSALQFAGNQIGSAREKLGMSKTGFTPTEICTPRGCLQDRGILCDCACKRVWCGWARVYLSRSMCCRFGDK